MGAQKKKLTVYFDGLCPLCSREIDHYRIQSGSENIDFTDITAESFDAGAEGLDPKLIHKYMHIRKSDGEVQTGVDAFIAIWDVLPRFNWMAKFANKTYVRPFLNVGYLGFAAVRPYLPRKSRDCETSPYCETRRP